MPYIQWQGLFQGGQGVLLPPPPFGNWPSLYYVIWGLPPLDLYLPPPLKFAAMRLPPLERNPKINPEWHLLVGACDTIKVDQWMDFRFCDLD